MVQLGEFFGGLIAVFVLHVLWEFLLFKRVCNDPVLGKLLSTVAAYATIVIVSGYGEADGGPWSPNGLIMYLPGALVVGAYSIWQGKRVRAKIAEGEVFE